jgi:hypothetical protein
MGTNGSALKYSTTCRIPGCGHAVLDHPLNVQIIGQPDARIQNFIAALMKHLAKKHPQELAQIQGISQFFMGWLAIGQYETQDPALLQTIQGFGAQLRKMAALKPIADAELEGATAALGFTMEDPKRELVLAALRNVRAYYEGTLQRPAETEAQKPLVTLEKP